MSAVHDALTSRTFCWTIERSDGAGLALTSHDRQVLRGGRKFRPGPGLSPAAISQQSSLDPHAGEVSGFLASDALSETDLMAGRWDGARTRLETLDWNEEAEPTVELASGEIGQVQINGTEFSADLLGPAARLSAPASPQTSPECRASLGGKQCRVDLRFLRMRAQVEEIAGDRVRIDRDAGEAFSFGLVRWLSGENCGLHSTIVQSEGRWIKLRSLPANPVVAGTAVLLTQGCDKRLETCSSRFANAVNFRGEPHLPGVDLLTRYPGA